MPPRASLYNNRRYLTIMLDSDCCCKHLCYNSERFYFKSRTWSRDGVRREQPSLLKFLQHLWPKSLFLYLNSCLRDLQRDFSNKSIKAPVFHPLSKMERHGIGPRMTKFYKSSSGTN